MDKVEWIWRDGEMILWDQANVHVFTHGLHYGLAVFEGIRCYAHKGGGGALVEGSGTLNLTTLA